MSTVNQTDVTTTAEKIVAQVDMGGRTPSPKVTRLIGGIAFSWSAFQLWIASPLPYMASDFLPVLNNTDTRSIHLAFGLLLAFLAYPALKNSPQKTIPFQDYLLAILGVIATMYLSVFAVSLAERPGLPTQTDLIIATIGMILVLEGGRRSLGLPLVIIALMFLAYVFF